MKKLSVNVIAETRANAVAMAHATDGEWIPDNDSGEDVGVFAGRSCYQSWSRPNSKTADTKGYLEHILEVGHFSVLRHASVTVYIQGVSRSLTHELIRHHVGIDFSQLSQRYVEVDPEGYVVPPAMRGKKLLEDQLWRAWQSALKDYEIAVKDLEADGKTRKEAREAARAFLPNCAETKIVVTANIQAWRNFIEQRGTEHADAEIRELAIEMAWILKQGFPNAFQDMHLRVVEGKPDTVYFGKYEPL